MRRLQLATLCVQATNGGGKTRSLSFFWVEACDFPASSFLDSSILLAVGLAYRVVVASN